jgi:hypothetical protein
MEWHVWNFPDNIRIYLNHDFRDLLYEKLIKICKTRIEIARKLNSNKETIRRSLYLGYRNKKEAYISVKLIKDIIKVFGEQLGSEFLGELEKNIIFYRSWNGWNVKNPKIPIEENPKVYSIVFHLMGDGNASARHSPFYSNKCKELLDEFKNDLQFFGNVETKTIVREDGVVKVYFPKAISDILSRILKIKFTRPQNLPERIFQASRECKIAAIRSFVDDEGSISSSFCICQKSSNVLRQFKELLESLNIKSGKVCTEDDIHKIYISRYSYREFKKSINLTHPKKHIRLINKIKIQSPYGDRYVI